MLQQTLLLIIELVVISIETFVIGVLIFHTIELRKKNKLTQVEIEMNKKTIKEIHTLLEKLHIGNNLSADEIREMHITVKELKKVTKALEKESKLMKRHMKEMGAK